MAGIVTLHTIHVYLELNYVPTLNYIGSSGEDHYCTSLRKGNETDRIPGAIGNRVGHCAGLTSPGV